MHIIAVGDVHGRDVWKEVQGRWVDQIIFIGDYVDPHVPIPDTKVIENFEQIIAYKKANTKKVTLLLGNHDTQYLHFPLYPCASHRADLQETLGTLFRNNAELFQVAWQYGKYLFSHAGISRGWYQQHQAILDKTGKKTLAATLNYIYHHKNRDILFEVGLERGGSHLHGGPIWADISETYEDFLGGVHQIVGHSRVPDFEYFGNGEEASITYIDVQDTRTRFYEAELPRVPQE